RFISKMSTSGGGDRNSGKFDLSQIMRGVDRFISGFSSPHASAFKDATFRRHAKSMLRIIGDFESRDLLRSFLERAPDYVLLNSGINYGLGFVLLKNGLFDIAQKFYSGDTESGVNALINLGAIRPEDV